MTGLRFSKNPYYRASLVMIAAAAVLAGTAVFSNRSDLTSAALVLASLTCMITGIFISLLSGSEPLDDRYVSLLPVSGCISVCRVAADLGIQGNACIIPSGKKGLDATMQYIPVSDYDGSDLTAETFVAGVTTAGMLLVPAGYPLLDEMRHADDLVVPMDRPAIPGLMQEVFTEILELADRVAVTGDDLTVTLTLEGYRFISGCAAMQTESPRCCTANPCPACSLAACILAEGTGAVVRVEQCSPDNARAAVTAIFSLVP